MTLAGRGSAIDPEFLKTARGQFPAFRGAGRVLEVFQRYLLGIAWSVKPEQQPGFRHKVQRPLLVR